jgi:hypothetical protein
MKAWSLNAKMAFVICILVTGSIVISAMGLTKMGGIHQILTDVTEVTFKRIEMDHNLKALFYIQIINERNYVIESNPEGRKVIAERIVKRDKEMHELLESRKAIADEAGLKSVAAFETAYNNWKTMDDQIVGLADAGDTKTAMELILTKGRQLRTAAEDIIEATVERNRKVMDDKKSEASNSYEDARSLSMITAAVSILLGVTLGFVILSALSKAISQVINVLTDNSMHVTTAAHQIASASEELSQASTEQASSLEETVATLEELTSMVKINADNAKQAAHLSENTRTVATQGEHDLNNLLKSMAEISADSKKIEDIINVIDDIAFQTNLLALNAAVEAARAGEQGKGFAVVAEAVRNLAHRSSTAAKDITALIKGSVEKVELGSAQAQKSGHVLGEIVSSVQKVTDLNSSIANASEDQFTGINQIGKAMNQLDQVTQINAATSEEAAASAQELSAQATQLSHTVEVLVTTIKGRSSASAEQEFVPKQKRRSNVLPMEQLRRAASTASHSSERESSTKIGDTVGF